MPASALSPPPDIDRRSVLAVVFVATFFASLVIASVRFSGYLQSAELALNDHVVSIFAQPNDSASVITIPITDKDLDLWGWPVPDQVLATLIENLEAAGAVAVGLDIYRQAPVPIDSESLKEPFSDPRAIAVYRLGATDGIAIEPPRFLAGSDRSGFTDMVVDPGGVVRRGLLLVTDKDVVHESFALRLTRAALGQDSLSAWPEDPTVLVFGETPVPRLVDGFGSYRGIDDRGYQVLIDWPHRPISSSFPASEVVSGAIDVEKIAGKVAIIGIASDSVKDTFRTPIDSASAVKSTYGMELHGAIVEQLLSYAVGRSAPVKSISPFAQLAMVVGAALVGAITAWMSRTILMAATLGFAVPILLSSVMALAFLRIGLWLPALPAATAWMLGFLVAYVAFSSILGRKRRTIMQLFTHHLSQELFTEIWANREIFLMGGKPVPRRLFATVLFTDLAGSTVIGGSTDPTDYMDWISRYLEAMSLIAPHHGGFVEKYTGDGIMVVFGAPLPHETEMERRADAVSACRCAIAMAQSVKALNANPSRIGRYKSRIGIHSGMVLGGTVGSGGNLRYNIIGDAVNIAARTEAFGKQHAPQAEDVVISVTEVTAGLAEGQIVVSPKGTLDHDNGKRKFQMFELMGLAIAPESDEVPDDIGVT